ncbi:GNAT family N-acetyltransferase [Blastococcus brunescens]|uniref:GNAT family N-acetyltransferase n=1 Tax=Blastococcus brunescens TaxID=1564165 RepID=A0ABZ1BBQ7_9ACTN|nr:GNAT family N-acetyltransferase [Blastococcus sp. BMG 8361]WRL67144.1 GNAT family N-acetyltransferase [Blastococcus sp. BMG 8361]
MDRGHVPRRAVPRRHPALRGGGVRRGRRRGRAGRGPAGDGGLRRADRLRRRGARGHARGHDGAAGEGIGSLLLDELLAEADRRSPVVLLEVRADNETAQHLYRRRGFVEIGRRRGYYQSSGADAVVMRRKRVRALSRAGGGRG